MGTIVVGTIVVTGFVNGWLLVGAGNLLNLPSTRYGQLLLAKLALFGVMLGLASLNRFRLTPAFERSIAAADHRRALGALRRSLAVEAACAITILAGRLAGNARTASIGNVKSRRGQSRSAT